MPLLENLTMANSYWASIGPLLQPPLKPDNNFKHKLEVGEQPIEPNRGAVLSKESNITTSIIVLPASPTKLNLQSLVGKKPHSPTSRSYNTDLLIPARFFALQNSHHVVARSVTAYRLETNHHHFPPPPTSREYHS